MARAQEGDRAAYRQLLDETSRYVRSLVTRNNIPPSDIEDTVQDVLLTVHAVRHTYDPSRPFGPWLVAIARRRIIDKLRQRQRLRFREIELDASHETFSGDQSNYEEPIWDSGELRQAIASLPSGQRQAVELLKLQELSLKEAATRSGKSIGSLKVASHRAIESLRALLLRPGG